MKAWIEIANPGKVEVSLTLTMPLDDWKSLKEELNDKWPAWQFKAIITEMVTKAQKQFTSRDEVEKWNLYQ